jgi:thiamine monophosphate kinase
VRKAAWALSCFRNGFRRMRIYEDAAALLDKDLHECFLGASDDYELIITCAADGVAAVRAAVSASYNGPVSKVGRITPPGTGICLVASDGSKKIVTAQGWDHYV